MKNIKVVISIVIVLLLAGCASSAPQAKFNPNNKRPIKANGKVYLIPRYVISYKIVDQERAYLYKEARVNCKVGDMEWKSLKGFEVLETVLVDNPTNEDLNKYLIVLNGLHKYGLMGCSRALTKKQVKSYRRSLDRRMANVNAQLNHIQSQKPIRYEVKHTGDVDVFVYN